MENFDKVNQMKKQILPLAYHRNASNVSASIDISIDGEQEEEEEPVVEKKKYSEISR
jgi:hypothetical protein